MTFTTTLKQPSAFLPLVMSFAALVTVLAHVVIFGVARQADEGTAAHFFQLLMVAEVPIAAFFAIKWLPRSPTQALRVLALHLIAALVALAPVFLLDLQAGRASAAHTRTPTPMTRFSHE